MQVMIQASYEFFGRHHSLGTGVVFVINHLNQPQLLKLSNPISRSSIRDAAKGAPAGMSLLNVGQGVMLSWVRPVAGTYTLVITANDNKNLSAQATIALTFN